MYTSFVSFVIAIISQYKNDIKKFPYTLISTGNGYFQLDIVGTVYHLVIYRVFHDFRA